MTGESAPASVIESVGEPVQEEEADRLLQRNHIMK